MMNKFKYVIKSFKIKINILNMKYVHRNYNISTREVSEMLLHKMQTDRGVPTSASTIFKGIKYLLLSTLPFPTEGDERKHLC